MRETLEAILILLTYSSYPPFWHNQKTFQITWFTRTDEESTDWILKSFCVLISFVLVFVVVVFVVFTIYWICCTSNKKAPRGSHVGASMNVFSVLISCQVSHKVLLALLFNKIINALIRVSRLKGFKLKNHNRQWQQHFFYNHTFVLEWSINPFVSLA